MGRKHNGPAAIGVPHYENEGVRSLVSIPFLLRPTPPRPHTASTRVCNHARIHRRVTDTRLYPSSDREKERQKGTQWQMVFYYSRWVPRASLLRSLLTGSEECRHEIILQYLTVGLSSSPFPPSIPISPLFPSFTSPACLLSPRRDVPNNHPSVTQK